MSECVKRCTMFKAEVVAWTEYVRELNVSKLTSEEINEICSVVTMQEVLARGSRFQTMFIEAAKRVVPERKKEQPAVAESAPLLDFIDGEEKKDKKSEVKQILTVDAPLPVEETSKKKRGRPRKKLTKEEAWSSAKKLTQETTQAAQEPAQAIQATQATPEPSQATQEPTQAAQELTLSADQEAEVHAWAIERMRPDLLAPPFHAVETADYFCGSILCDNALCGRDNTIIRIPKEEVDQCYVQYRCADCGERGQVLFTQAELKAVITENRRVNYSSLIIHQSKFERAYNQARIEFLTPRNRKIEVPKNKPKLLPKPIQNAVEITPVKTAKKEIVPDIVNDLDGIESTSEIKQIVSDVLAKASPMAVNLEVAERELMLTVKGMSREVLITQWEGLTGKTWSEDQNVEQAAQEVVRSILNIRGV